MVDAIVADLDFCMVSATVIDEDDDDVVTGRCHCMSLLRHNASVRMKREQNRNT